MAELKGKRILITGGLGFVGINAALRFARQNKVCVVDDCSRIGVESNIALLNKVGVDFHRADVSRYTDMREIFHEFKPDVVIHLAAQVAVTLSMTNPVRDFKSNVMGSFNILELARTMHDMPIVLYASTNKVYGDCCGDARIEGGRYVTGKPQGVSEDVHLSFETPYGCSKGSADQYFLDYARSFDMRTVVFRQSCIYGPQQYGMEDQGWVAWFAICAEFNKPLTIFGDGNQVRDVLYVDDLLDLYEAAVLNIDQAKGQVFNVGGGPNNTLSLNELVNILNAGPRALQVSYSDWRPGDQKVFICDIAKATRLLGWVPKISPKEGIERLSKWIASERAVVESVLAAQDEAKQRCDVSIVIPAHNEEACLPHVLDEIEVMMKGSAFNWEIIVVNDRSRDKTVEIAKGYNFVTVIDSKYPGGKGGALRTGFEKATGTFIGMMDADFSHSAFDLPHLIEEVQRTKGMCIGSRQTGGSEEYTKLRTFGNVFLTWWFGFVHGRNMSDILNGLKVFHRDIFTGFIYDAMSFDIEIELTTNALRLKRPLTEIPARERERMGGEAKSRVVEHGLQFFWRILSEWVRGPRWAEGGQEKINVTFSTSKTLR
jgi:CDP-paratose 2-epimerase